MENITQKTRGVEHTRAYLRLLDQSSDEFCFRTFDDNKDRADKSLTRKFNGTLEQHQTELMRLNAAGAGVFVVVNHGGQTSVEIDRVRAVFGDTDGAPLEPLLALKPHMLVQSSPGNWHAYWLTDNGFSLNAFTQIQEAIAAKFGTDPVVKDLPRVMRLPGFNHCKAAPFPVKIIQYEKSLPRYTVEQVITGLELAIGATTMSKAISAYISEVPEYMRGHSGNLAALCSTPETPDAIAHLQSALACIPPDCDRCTWRDVVWSILAHEWDCAADLARDWSMGGMKYDEGDFLRVVQDYRP